MKKLFLLCFLLISVLPVHAENDFKIEHLNWEQPIQDGGVVRVKNSYGDIRVRRGPDSMVLIFAIIQYNESDTARARVLIENHGEVNKKGLDINVAYRRKNKEDKQPMASEMIRRVDLTLYIPTGSLLDVQTLDGKIIAKGLKSDILAKSEGGDIFLRTSGTAKACSEDGRLTIFFKNPDWSWSPVFETITGHISVRMPEKASVSVEASTAGKFITEYSLQVHSVKNNRFKKANALLLSGKHKMKILSKEGNIEILRPLQ